MKQVSLYLCLLLAPLLASAQSPVKEDKRLAGFDQQINALLKDWHASGLAIAIVEKDKVIYAKGFGYRDYEKKLPVTTSTLFAIGSCSKAFTGSLLGMQREEGKLDFETPVRNYMPELVFSNDELNSKVTLKDMMSHRTGLPRYDLSWYLFDTPSRDTLLHRIRYMIPNEPFRAKWQYNNFMYLAQGMVVEKVSGKSWEDNVKTRIFGPLEMKSSNTSIEDLKRSPDAATGYYVKKDSIITKTAYKGIDAIGPAGSINSNINDMSNWVTTWLNGGKFKGKEILSQRYTREAMSPQMIVDGGFPTKDAPDLHFSCYGYGWILGSYRGHYLVEHGGNIDGFSADVCLFPTDSIGIVILVNQSVSVIPRVATKIIADRFFELKARDWNDFYLTRVKAAKGGNAPKKDSVQTRIKGADVVRPAADYEGTFANAAYGRFKISSRKDSLFATYPIGTDYLKHVAYDIFQPYSVDSIKGVDTTVEVPVRVQFFMNTEGEIISAGMNLEEQQVVFTRQIDNASFIKYAGIYEINKMEIKIYLRGEQLMMFVPGQQDYTLISTGTDKFKLKELNGFSVEFNMNDKKEVVSVTAVQPNGRFVAKKK
ncbi:serine hydrolase [Chitinophaga tropicalis]|nr:serine hydrolase [Chitinophaga tropicalis]